MTDPADRPKKRFACAGIGLLLAVALVAAPAARAVATPAGQRPGGAHMKVRVDLVSVFTSVLDAAGRPVADLPRSAFRLYQDGKREPIALFERRTNMPLDLALMIDTSLSAAGDLKFERQAAEDFIHQVLRPGDRAAVFTFAYHVTELSPFTGSTAELDAALRRVRVGTGTSLFDAIYLGSRSLERQPPGRRRVLLLVTDAGETTSRTSYEGARNAAIRSGAMLYTMLIRVVKSDTGRNTAGEHAIDTIMASTGGAMYPVETPAEFAPTFGRIDRELRTEYLLGFYPKPPPPPGSHHTILVRVSPPTGGAGYQLHYRTEYFTPEARP